MKELLERQRAAFEAERPVSLAVRQDRLKRCMALIYENQDALIGAFAEDFGHRSLHLSKMSDIYATLETFRFNLKHVGKWVRPERRSVGALFRAIGASGRIEYQPKGVVGILGTWNFPLNTLFSPLAGVLAAGNRAMLKGSEVAPKSAELIAELVAKYFDPTEVTCVLGGPEVAAEFSALPFDHLVFTGSERVGKLVMRAASENLTPVTLELGGKSPVIVTDEVDVKEAAIRIMTGKGLNVGQACLAPDYVLVVESQLEAFLAHTTEWTRTMFPTVAGNDDYTAIVSERHHARLSAYLDEARAAGADVRALHDDAGEPGMRRLPMHVIVNPPADLKVAQEEIFGPILLVHSVRDVDAAIAHINARPRPLGLYIFAKKTATLRRILDQTHSGGVTINDVLIHTSIEDLPFGGVGASGMGHYRGEHGFKTFSHARAVYSQSRISLQRLSGMLPPFGDRAEKALAQMIRP